VQKTNGGSQPVPSASELGLSAGSEAIKELDGGLRDRGSGGGASKGLTAPPVLKRPASGEIGEKYKLVPPSQLQYLSIIQTDKLPSRYLSYLP